MYVRTLVVGLFAASAFAAPPTTAINPQVKAVHEEIRQGFGSVPTFVKSVPDEALPGAWEDMKALEMSTSTSLSPKLKSLIAVAVAAQIPCRYCLYADSSSAKSAGATDRELREAITMAANVRRWSTVLNGMQVDEVQFKKDLAKLTEMQPTATAAAPLEKATGGSGATPESTTPGSAPDVMKDIENTLGFVPAFVRAYPAAGLPGAWAEMKNFQMSKTTALSPKEKELIGLAVAAQIPCHYCVAFHTAVATKQLGATAQELQEAVGMSALTRHWSTILNGSQQDEVDFRREWDQAQRYMKKSQKKMQGTLDTP